MAKTPSRSALLARELLGRIARRELRPGDPIDLPALGRRHGVSRTVVREALADLGGKGLVVARPKVGTTIAPESAWNLLDPVLVAVAIAESGPDSMLAEASELRRVIEPALAADAARDAGRPQQAAVLDALRALAGAVGDGDADALAEADAALHAAIADACSNRLLRSIDHALVPVRALQRRRLLAAQMTAAGPGPDVIHAVALQTALALAIVRRDAASAADRALALATAARAHLPEPARADAVPLRERPVFAPAGPVPASDAPAEDWPETATMQRTAGPFEPARRGRLAPDDTGAALDVPALLAESARDAAAIAAPR